MQALCSESVFVSQIFDTDWLSIGTCVRVGSLNNLCFKVLIAQILYESLGLCLLAVSRSVSISEAAVGRNFIVVTGDRCLVAFVLKLTDAVIVLLDLLITHLLLLLLLLLEILILLVLQVGLLLLNLLGLHLKGRLLQLLRKLNWL